MSSHIEEGWLSYEIEDKKGIINMVLLYWIINFNIEKKKTGRD